jgi:hypothetical protein
MTAGRRLASALLWADPSLIGHYARLTPVASSSG